MVDRPSDVISLSAAQRDLVWRRVFGARAILALVAVACLWLVYALDWVGIDLLDRASHDETAESSHLILFLVLTLLIVAYGIWDSRRGLALAYRGVLVRARVSSVSSLQNSGCVPVRYSYVFKGKSYGGACDVGQDQASMLAAGSPFWLVVDAHNPRNSDYVHALAHADHEREEDL